MWSQVWFSHSKRLPTPDRSFPACTQSVVYFSVHGQCRHKAGFTKWLWNPECMCTHTNLSCSGQVHYRHFMGNSVGFRTVPFDKALADPQHTPSVGGMSHWLGVPPTGFWTPNSLCLSFSSPKIPTRIKERASVQRPGHILLYLRPFGSRGRSSGRGTWGRGLSAHLAFLLL